MMTTVIRVDIGEAKTHLSRYLARVRAGETVVVCRRNEPIAEILPIAQQSSEPRPFGLSRGRFSVPASFFDPLPEAVLGAFDGGESGDDAEDPVVR